jgi:predicted hotdog family 3-hydroxylacyl-ACP dehydratase
MNVVDADPRLLVPHGGAMRLVERIVRFDDREILCATTTHRSPSNPLRSAGRLAALHLAEYGAQTMAVHGALLNPAATQRGGMLVAIRDLSLELERLDDIADDLEILAVKLVANADGRIYSFSATAAGRALGRGRVSVLFPK